MQVRRKSQVIDSSPRWHVHWEVGTRQTRCWSWAVLPLGLVGCQAEEAVGLGGVGTEESGGLDCPDIDLDPLPEREVVRLKVQVWRWDQSCLSHCDGVHVDTFEATNIESIPLCYELELDQRLEGWNYYARASAWVGIDLGTADYFALIPDLSCRGCEAGPNSWASKVDFFGDALPDLVLPKHEPGE